MYQLKFDYSDNRPRIPGSNLKPLNFSEEDKRAFEAKYNKLYSKYIEVINKDGGYIKAGIDMEGKLTMFGDLFASAETHDLINDDPEIG